MIKKAHDIEAAMLRLEPLLAALDRGAEVTFEWVRTYGAIADARRMDYRLRRYFSRRGIRLCLRADRWLVLDDRAQKVGVAARQSHVRREHARSFHEIRNVDRSKLTNIEQAEADHLQRHAVKALDLSHQLTRELRAILRAPEPAPRPEPTADSERPRAILGVPARGRH